MLRYFSILLLLTLVACEADDLSLSDVAGGSAGTGGSLARFTIVGNFLYTLETDQLEWFRLETDGSISDGGELTLAAGKETLFPFGELLFMGATDGMSIYRLADDGTPTLESEIQHFVSCDPVVANAQYAYVTLRQTGCGSLFRPGQTTDVLNIYDIGSVSQVDPFPVAQYPLDSPAGIGLRGDLLFICERENGLRVWDVSDPQNAGEISRVEGIFAQDVIVLDDLLLVIGPDNITQFDYSDPTALREVSSIRL